MVHIPPKKRTSNKKVFNSFIKISASNHKYKQDLDDWVKLGVPIKPMSIPPDLEISEKWSCDKVLEQRMQHLSINTVYRLVITTAVLHYASIFPWILHQKAELKTRNQHKVFIHTFMSFTSCVILWLRLYIKENKTTIQLRSWQNPTK